ncbi:MAG: hypothetical protein DRJ42_14005 [Deltaproteobacteria bacterium]|nr:MAG: hypothetical protein DRJ42_14005 [Deltaproteobacteria bacterium]
MGVPSALTAARLFASVSRLHIVAIATLGTFTFGWLFTGAYPWLLAAICAVDWFVVNLLNRVVDLQEDKANRIVGTGFVEQNRRLLMVVGFGALFASFIGTYLVVPEITGLRLAYHALGLSYNWPLLPGKRRIKELYFFKNTASGMGFIITVFLYPLASIGWSLAGAPAGVTTATVVLSAAFFLTFELSYEAIYDLRDAEGDAEANVRTYAVVHGEAGALRIIDALIATSIVVQLVGYGAGLLPWRFFIMVVAPVAQLFLYKRAHRRGLTSKDCISLTWLGAGMLLAYHLWVIAGLPGVGV